MGRRRSPWWTDSHDSRRGPFFLRTAPRLRSGLCCPAERGASETRGPEPVAAQNGGVKRHRVLGPVVLFSVLPSGNFSCTKNNRKMQRTREDPHSANIHPTHTLRGPELQSGHPRGPAPLLLPGLRASLLGPETAPMDGDNSHNAVFPF